MQGASTPTAKPGATDVYALGRDAAESARLQRQFTAQRGLGSVRIVAADARRTGLPAGSFDLVHARTLLVTVPDPAAVVAEMVRLAKPGGGVASLEPDGEGTLCYPAHPAYTRMSELFRADQAELDALDRTARGHLDDPRTLVMPHLTFLAWGRKPSSPDGKG